MKDNYDICLVIKSRHVPHVFQGGLFQTTSIPIATIFSTVCANIYYTDKIGGPYLYSVLDLPLGAAEMRDIVDTFKYIPLVDYKLCYVHNDGSPTSKKIWTGNKGCFESNPFYVSVEQGTDSSLYIKFYPFQNPAVPNIILHRLPFENISESINGGPQNNINQYNLKELNSTDGARNCASCKGPLKEPFPGIKHCPICEP